MHHFVLRAVLLTSLSLTLTACGGGGGASKGSTPTTVPAYSKVELKIGLYGDTGGKAIAGVGFTLAMPANVTPSATNGVVAPGVVVPSGTFAGDSIAPVVTYIAASGTSKGTMQIVLPSSVSAGVATVGEIVTINLQLSGGEAPVAGDFSLNNGPVTVIDTNGNQLAGVTLSAASVSLK
jgi:hypothetical protein